MFKFFFVIFIFNSLAGHPPKDSTPLHGPIHAHYVNYDSRDSGLTNERTYDGIRDQLVHQSLRDILLRFESFHLGKFGSILDSLAGHRQNWIWIIREGKLPEFTNGMTVLTSDGAVTTLDFSKLKKATNLSAARTILHEMVHAYLTLYYRFDPAKARKDFPDIYTAWLGSYDYFDYSEAQHEEIEKYFVGDIALNLKAYGESTGLFIDDIVYRDLAWGGLDFENSAVLTDFQKQRIQYRLIVELTNRRLGAQKPLGLRLEPEE
jgi:hypothetical protein